MRRWLRAAALVPAAVVALSAQAPPLAIVDATVIPLTSDEAVLPHHTVVVQGRRIVAVGPVATTAVPSDARRLDGRGTYVIPGLADMHVHLEYFDDPSILRLFVDAGVTTVRNMDGRPYLLEWKRRIAAGTLTGPRIYTAGPVLDGTPPVRPDNTVVESAAQAEEIVAAQAAAGYDVVKVYSGLSAEAYDGIARAARARGLPVAGHVPRAVGLERVLLAGHVAIEHVADYATSIEADDSPFKGKGHWSKRYLSAPQDPSRLATVAAGQAKAGVWTVPTLIQPLREVPRSAELERLLASPQVARIPADGRQQWEAMTRRILARMDDEDWALIARGASNRLAVVKALHRAGARVLAGTDTPNPFVVPGSSLHEELALLVEAGMSPGAALAAATREAARFLGGDWGVVTPGTAADMIILDGNPLADIRNTWRVRAVVRDGALIESAQRSVIEHKAR